MPTPTGEQFPFYVTIAGNIGVGKTMVTDLIGERLGGSVTTNRSTTIPTSTTSTPT